MSKVLVITGASSGFGAMSAAGVVDAAIAKIVADCGRLDVVTQNAGHMVLGPAEAFSPEEIDGDLLRA
jgi:NADP-dependent 3-hydroxy acid dehydrogenase YdfG